MSLWTEALALVFLFITEENINILFLFGNWTRTKYVNAEKGKVKHSIKSKWGRKKFFSYHLTQHTTRGHFTSLYSLNSTNIFHIQNPGEKLLERNSIELYACLPHDFLSCKNDFSQHHPSQAVRCRFNGPSPSCCYSLEQDSDSAHVKAQAAGPWQFTPIQLSYIKEPYILGNSLEK